MQLKYVQQVLSGAYRFLETATLIVTKPFFFSSMLQQKDVEQQDVIWGPATDCFT